MATIDKHGAGWRAQIRRKGYPKLTATFSLRKQAEQWAAQREAEIVHGRLGILPKHTLGEALVKFRKEEAPKRRGGRWERNRINSLLGVDKDDKSVAQPDPITAMHLAGLNSSHLNELRDRELARPHSRTGKPRERTTVRRTLSLLSSVFKAARGWKWLAHNPFQDFERPRPKAGRRRGIRQHEIDAVVAALGFQEHPPATLGAQVAIEFLLAVETAMRDSEMLRLAWPFVFEKHVHLPETKNSDERDVALSARARELLGYMRGVDPVRVFTVDAATRDALFRDARQRASLSGFTFHDSRSEGLSRLAKKLEILELARMTGHRDLNSLLIYYQDSAADVADKLG